MRNHGTTPKRNLLVVTFGSFAILAVSYWAFFRFGTGATVERGDDRLEASLPYFASTQAAYAKHPVFSPGPGSADAGPSMNPRIRWLKSCGEAQYPAGGPKLNPLMAPEWARNNQSQLTWENAAKVSLVGVDLDWLKALQSFDYWEVFKNSPVDREVRGWEVGTTDDLAFFTELQARPVFDQLYVLAKLRLIQGIQRRQLAPALTEVVHLAKLIASTESIEGFVTAAQLVVDAQSAFDFGVSRRMVPANYWQKLRIENPAQFLHSLHALTGFFSVRATSAQIESSWGKPEHSFGRCAMIENGTIAIAELMPYFSGRYPLEGDYAHRVAVLRRIVLADRTGCRLVQVRKYWKKIPSHRARNSLCG